MADALTGDQAAHPVPLRGIATVADFSTLPATILLAGLLVLGGGGSPAPLLELACQLLAVVALGAWLWGNRALRAQRPAWLITATLLVVVIPLLQLIPLPPSVWRSLPGREATSAALDLVGSGASWRPISLAPHRTLASLLALGPPLALLWIVAHACQSARTWLIRTVAIMAGIAALVGAGQLSGIGNSAFDFYVTNDHGIVHGFLANRNTAADVFLIGLVALTAIWGEVGRGQTRTISLAYLAAAALLLVAIMLTRSRTGIVLIPLALLFCGAIAWPFIWHPPRAAKARLGLVLVSLSGMAGLWLLKGTTAFSRVAARFDFSGEFRPELWRDSWFAAKLYWPLGSGIGTFIPAFGPAERLEVVDQTLPHRAHNELLELALEGGLPLLICWLALAGLLTWRWLAVLTSASSSQRGQALFAAAALVIAGLHSLVDYPLRAMAMAGLVAVAAGIVLSADRRAMCKQPVLPELQG